MEVLLEQRTNNLEFDGEEWNREVTCWQFVMGDNANVSRLVGDTIGKRVTASMIRRPGGMELLKEVIREEMAATYGYYIEETENFDYLPEYCEFKILVKVDTNGNYHMMKMYQDGQWWRKWVGVQPTDIGPLTGQKITNPLYECLEGEDEVFFIDVYIDEWY